MGNRNFLNVYLVDSSPYRGFHHHSSYNTFLLSCNDVKVIVIRQKEAILLIGDGSQDSVIIECPPSQIVCRGLRDIVVGQDPFDVEKIWNDMYINSYYYGRRSVGLHAMSGIDMAV